MENKIFGGRRRNRESRSSLAEKGDVLRLGLTCGGGGGGEQGEPEVEPSRAKPSWALFEPESPIKAPARERVDCRVQ